MRGWKVVIGLALAASWAAACSPCLEQGANGVPAPGPDQFQLVFSNIVSRETVLYVDGQEVGEVCMETEFATVGNFPVNTHTVLMLKNMLSGTDCYISPNCDNNCDAQQCQGDEVLDTTPFAGRIFATGFIWRQ
jgi:hypothetical protein